MSSRMLSSLPRPGPSTALYGLQRVAAFHSSTVVTATQKGRGKPSKPTRGRGGSKGPSRTQFRSTSRTRLVKDLKPEGLGGKYEVAKNPHGAKIVKVPEPHEVVAQKNAEVEALLDEEFDRSSPVIVENLPDSFSSPPLLSTLSKSVLDVLGPDAIPTPIQALALKHLVPLSSNAEKRQILLASETGSGKSFAYLLPLLQHLKETEGHTASHPSRLPINPRALILAPTHELTRQLSAFAKSLVHLAKLRVLCASRANVPSRKIGRVGARQMKHLVGQASEAEGQLDIHPQSISGTRPVDVLASTPVKALEMVRGWGWDKIGNEGAEWEGRKFRPGKPEMGLKRVEVVVVDEADVLFDPDFRETTLNLLSDISSARGQPIPSDAQTINYPFHLILTSATIPASLSTYLSAHHPKLTRLASPNLHRLPATLHTEYVGWTGGNRFADIERRLRRVWAEDGLRGPSTETGRISRSRVLVFCNRSTMVDALGAHLNEHGIPNVTLTSTGPSRTHGSNRHLSGFLKGSDASTSTNEDANAPHVLITTSLLSRGLDFSPSLQHVFIVDSPRNMIDFLHRAGRSGRAGQQGKVVVFGKLKGRGSGVDVDLKSKVRALARR